MDSTSGATTLQCHDDRDFHNDAETEGAYDGVSIHDNLLIDNTLEEDSLSLLYLFSLTCGVGG